MRCAVIFGLTLPSQTTSFFSHHQFFIFFPEDCCCHTWSTCCWGQFDGRLAERCQGTHQFIFSHKHRKHNEGSHILITAICVCYCSSMSASLTENSFQFYLPFFFVFACHALTVCVRGQCCSHHKKGVVDKLWIPHWLIVTFQVDVVNLSIYTSSSYLHYPLKLLFAKSSTHQSLMLLGTAKKTSKQNK